VWFVVVVVVLHCGVAACGDNVDDKTAQCQLGTASSAATVEDRKVIGLAAPYAPDLGLAARDGELEASITARRAAAWQIVGRVLQPVPLGDPRLAANFGGTQPVVPAWHTWYARDDFERVFKTLYRDLGPAGRAARAPLDAAAGFAWNATALDQDPAWPEQRYLDYLAAIDAQPKADGVGGISRVGYSPGAMGHLVESYAKQYACRLAVDPEPFAIDPMRAPRAVTRTETVELAQCGFRVFGPFQAGDGPATATPTSTSATAPHRRPSCSTAGRAARPVTRRAPPPATARSTSACSARSPGTSRSTSSTSSRTSAIRPASTASCRAMAWSSRPTGAASSPASCCRPTTPAARG
jgi:hypothetical protein